MKTILVPTDFSECANNALRFAAFVAKKTGATLNLLHVHEVPLIGYQGSIEATVDDVPYMMSLLKATKAKMKKTLSLPFMKDIKVVHNIETGRICDHILKAAEKYEVDLIIMGTHGASGLQETIIGSNAERIAQNSLIPVLTIKDEFENPKIEKIVFATDFSEETEYTFPEVEKLANLLDAKIEIVKIITKSEFETTQRLQRAIKRFKNKFKHSNYIISTYCDYNKQAGIRHFAKNIQADIIALGTQGRHGLLHFFNNNITESLVNHSSIPILAFNFHRKNFKKDYVIHEPQHDEMNLEKAYLRSQIPVI